MKHLLILLAGLLMAAVDCYSLARQAGKDVIYMQGQTFIPRHDIEELMLKAVTLGAEQRNSCSANLRHLYKRIEQDPGKVTTELFAAFQRGIEREEKKQEKEAYRQFFREDPEPDIISKGYIHPWTLLDSTPVGIEETEDEQGIRVAGRSGGGKTTCIFNLMASYLEAGISFFCIDSKGNEFDGLARLCPDKKILFATIGKTENVFNPFICWKKLRNYFLNIYERHDSGTLYDQALSTLEQQQILSGRIAPTLNSIIETVSKLDAPVGSSSFHNKLRHSMLTALERINSSPLQLSIETQQGWPLKEILEKGISVIINTSQIAGTTEEEFLVVSMLQAIIETKQQHNLQKKVAFVIDEGSTVANKRYENGRSLAPIVHLSTLVRSNNIVLVIGYHSPSSVSEMLHSAYFMVSACLMNQEEIACVQKAAFLTNEQAEAISQFPPGVCMIRMAGRHVKPFLMTYKRIPDFPVLTDEEIDQNNAAILSELPLLIPAEFRQTVNVSENTQPKPEDRSNQANISDHKAILVDIEKRFWLGVKARAESIALPSCAKLTWKSLMPVLEQLHSQGFCDSLFVQMYKKPTMFWYLTKAGHESIGSVVAPARGGTSLAHFFFQRLIQYMFAEKQIKADLEVAKQNCPQADIGLTDPETGLNIAVECCLSTETSEYQKVQDMLSPSHWDRILVVAPLRDKLNKVEEHFKKELLVPPSITLCLLADIKMYSLKDILNWDGLVYGKQIRTCERR